MFHLFVEAWVKISPRQIFDCNQRDLKLLTRETQIYCHN